jgi:hypothetical protein
MARATTTRAFRYGDTAWFNSFLRTDFSGRHTIGGGLFGCRGCQPIIGDRDGIHGSTVQAGEAMVS